MPDLPSVPVQPIILAMQEEPGMFDFYRNFRLFLNVHRYASQEQLIADLGEEGHPPRRTQGLGPSRFNLMHGADDQGGTDQASIACQWGLIVPRDTLAGRAGAFFRASRSGSLAKCFPAASALSGKLVCNKHLCHKDDLARYPLGSALPPKADIRPHVPIDPTAVASVTL